MTDNPHTTQTYAPKSFAKELFAQAKTALQEGDDLCIGFCAELDKPNTSIISALWTCTTQTDFTAAYRQISSIVIEIGIRQSCDTKKAPFNPAAELTVHQLKSQIAYLRKHCAARHFVIRLRYKKAMSYMGIELFYNQPGAENWVEVIELTVPMQLVEKTYSYSNKFIRSVTTV